MGIFEWCILTRKFVVHFNPQNDKAFLEQIQSQYADYEHVVVWD